MKRAGGWILCLGTAVLMAVGGCGNAHQEAVSTLPAETEETRKPVEVTAAPDLETTAEFVPEERIAVDGRIQSYLTGEMKHHEELEAARSRLTVVAAGHYHTEKVFAEFLASYLRKRIPGTAFLLSQGEAPPMGAL